ncbi:hypothetical protein BGZ60DRAFT_408807 [Tricladium varicosporioides]|nr:hypothetical protein BGZ60DRAFT_408807 [Hymenoscyphus varicosporioides]
MILSVFLPSSLFPQRGLPIFWWDRVLLLVCAGAPQSLMRCSRQLAAWCTVRSSSASPVLLYQQPLLIAPNM